MVETNVFVPRDKPLSVQAIKCYIHNHTICTNTGVFGGRGIVSDTVTKTPISAAVCLESFLSKRWKFGKLVENKGMWHSNISLVVNFKWSV